ncbi:MAG: ABC transporter permease, partial [Alphaproteobacteria bacterium]|nr:ABC transporter permease [Alphaproteobacteria bacterium]
MSAPIELPKWADVSLVPSLAVIVAFLIAGLVVLGIGENPVKATTLLIKGALGSGEGLGYTLYYATNFIFTGLAVAIAFHAGLFNIGGEGQATIGGLGAALVCLHLDFLPWYFVLPLAILGTMIMGALWAFIPGYLQVKRGSHVVITTIMFNFLAATLVVYLLVNVIGKPGSMSPETRVFSDAAHLPYLHEALAYFGIKIPKSPLNLSFIFALVASAFVWILIWHTRLGFAIRTVGHNPTAALYAGISIGRITMITMAMSGALAGLLAVNEILGVQGRLLLEFSSGYGFIGIAVALMGRAHPLGIIFA